MKKSSLLLVLLIFNAAFFSFGQTFSNSSLNNKSTKDYLETVVKHIDKQAPKRAFQQNRIIHPGTSVLNYRQFGYGVELTPMLESIGLTVTSINGTSNLDYAISSGEWDLMILQVHGNPLSSSEISAVTNFVSGGGKVIMAYFELDQSEAIKTSFGIANTIDYYTPIPIFVWDETHPIFNTPNNINGLYLNGDPGITLEDGGRMEPTLESVALGGFVSTPASNQAAIIIGNNNSTIFHGFTSMQIISSLYIDFIENEIEFLFSQPNIITQQNTALNACVDFYDGYIFTDSGGDIDNYQNNESSTIEFVAVPGETVTVTFTSFDLEASSICGDTLTVLGDANGSDGTYSGDIQDSGSGLSCIDATDASGNPILGPFTSTPSGSLSFTFTSNGTNQQNGWEAILSITSDCIPTDNVIIQQDGLLNACTDFEGGETYTDTGRTFDTYENNESSTLQFCAEPDEIITIDFTYFSTELNVDILTIVGSTSSDGNYSGTNSPGLVTSLVSGCLSFSFVSNDSVNLGGWSALISDSGECIPIIYEEIPQQNAVFNACEDFEGGEIFTDSGGIVGEYSDFESSTIQFCPGVGKTVTLDFTEFILEPQFDTLSIVGSQASDGTFDNANSPGTVTSVLGECVSFTFNSDESVVRIGWRATISLSSDCNALNVEDFSLEDQLFLYPNPAENIISIYCNSMITLTKADIYDLTGNLIDTIDLSNQNETYSHDITSLANSVYFLKIYSTNETTVKRFIKR